MQVADTRRAPALILGLALALGLAACKTPIEAANDVQPTVTDPGDAGGDGGGGGNGSGSGGGGAF